MTFLGSNIYLKKKKDSAELMFKTLKSHPQKVVCRLSQLLHLLLTRETLKATGLLFLHRKSDEL